MNNALVIIISLLIGFAFGTIFSFFNHYLLLRAFRTMTLEDEAKDKQIITRAYFWRYIINIVALVAVFIVRAHLPFKWEYILIGTAIGLTIPGRILAMKTGFEKKPDFIGSRVTEPEKIEDLLPKKTEDGRVIVDDKAFFNDLNKNKEK